MAQWIDAPRPVTTAGWGAWTVVCAAVFALWVVRPASAQTPDAVDTPYVELQTLNWPGGGTLEEIWTRRTNRRIAAERLRRFPDSPHTVGWLMQADRIDDALDLLSRVVERTPARLPEAVEGFARMTIQRDQTHGYRDRLSRIIDAARHAQASLGREDAARVEAALVAIDLSPVTDINAKTARLERIVASVADTPTAAWLGIDLAVSRGVSRRAIDELDAIAAAWPHTETAAKALFTKGAWLSRDYFSLVLDKAAPANPTAALLEVFDIVADLESGRYPSCRWVTEAPGLVLHWHVFEPGFSQDDARRLLDRIHRFLSAHTTLFDSPIAVLRPSYFVTSWMPVVAGALPDGGAVMLAQLEAFEREWADPGLARLLQVEWLTGRTIDASEVVAEPPPSVTSDDRVRALLESASRSATPRVARRALALLAERDFERPSTRDRARARFAEYVRRFPSADDAWMASIRMAQVDDVLRRPAQARVAFEEAAARYASDPMVATLAHAFAGHQAELQDDYPEAARHFERALAVWPRDFGDVVALPLPFEVDRGSSTHQATNVDSDVIERSALLSRLAELQASLRLAGGLDFERGRRLITEGRAADAAAVFDTLARRHGDVGIGAMAREYLGRTRIELALTNAASPDASDVARAVTALDAVSAVNANATGALAGVVAATARFTHGDRADADRRMSLALSAWVRDGASRAPSPSSGSLEADVIAIRDAVFQPLGHPVLTSRLAGGPALPVLPRFIPLPSTLRVTGPGIDVRSIDVSRAPAGLAATFFISTNDRALLERAIGRLADAMTSDARSHAGDPLSGPDAEIARWWNEYSPAVVTYFGLRFETIPTVRSIEFTNAARTRALVPVGFGLSGATVVVEKVDGVWRMKELVSSWVS